MDASGKGSISSGAVYRLALGLGLLEPLAGDRVYNVQHAQLVVSVRLLEVSVEFLNEHRLGLDVVSNVLKGRAKKACKDRRGPHVPGRW